jgi:hypothetical protein
MIEGKTSDRLLVEAVKLGQFVEFITQAVA